MAQPSTVEAQAEADNLGKLLSAITKMAREAKADSFTGSMTIVVDFHRGGITARKFQKGWTEK